MDRREFLTLGVPDFGIDDEESSPIQPHLDTLFAEFSRSRSRATPPRSPTTPRLRRTHARSIPLNGKAKDENEPKIDLRALDYISDYDSHLICPICHVPFVQPVVLECDHTFCTTCYEEYTTAADDSQRSQCPTCRTSLLDRRPRKASRLIVNMCNDIKVRCPNEDCEETFPRGYIEQHATKDCPDWRIKCPDTTCGKMVKRKNFVPNQCIHISHIECDCGAIIELGRGEWLKHKDEECPTTSVKCDFCDERISVKDYLAGRNAHICKTSTLPLCPGAEFGCMDDLSNTTVEDHTSICPLARIAPYLRKQSQLLSSLTDQLTLTKVRNEVLETGLEKLTNLINDRILPTLPHSRPSSPDHDHDHDIEEIPRAPPSLSLPAHLRPLTPSPVPGQQPTSTDLMTLHNNLQDSISHLSTQLISLQTSLTELDARTSMTVMNETLRLKEEQAHQAAGLFSTRSQVQWLLNRERERVMSGQTLRGRLSQSGAGVSQAAQAQAGLGAGQQRQTSPGAAQSAAGGGMATEPGTALAGGGGMGMASSRSSEDAGEGVSLGGGEPRSPTMATASTTSPMMRPILRRLSGSQERVKL